MENAILNSTSMEFALFISLILFRRKIERRNGEQNDSRLFLMGAGTNVGERTDGERDCHRRGRPKSSGRHEQQRFIGSCPRPGEATANVYAGADQLKRGVTPLEEAQMSQRLLRLSTLLTQRTQRRKDRAVRREKIKYAKVNEGEASDRMDA